LRQNLVEGVGPGAEFRRVRHRIDEAAICFEMLDQNVGFVRHFIGENRRALRRADAGNVHQILDRDGEAGERAALRDWALEQLVGLAAGTLEA
jgi:hypothetical protein